MNIIEAAKELKSGKCIRRKDWVNPKGFYILGVERAHDLNGNRWTFSNDDLTAEWEVSDVESDLQFNSEKYICTDRPNFEKGWFAAQKHFSQYK